MEDVFKKEIKVLRNAEYLLDSGALESTNDAKLYETLVEEYRNLLGQARRLVKISDLMELKLKRVSQRLEEISNLDFLTNLPNRRYFYGVINKEWLKAIDSQTQLSIIMIDVDFFKAYNDIYGHLQGDQCLQSIASAIQKSIKRKRDFAARFGGEEFIVLLPDTSLADTKSLANLIAHNISELNIFHSGSPIDNKVSVSMGIATLIPSKDTSPDLLIRKADDALYHAKFDGKNCISEDS